MKTERFKSAVWRVISILVVASLVLFSSTATSGMASQPDKKGKGKRNVALAPVAPPKIKTQPLYLPNGKIKKNTTGSMQDELSKGDILGLTKDLPEGESWAYEMISPPTALAATASATHLTAPRDMKVLIISPDSKQVFGDYDTSYRLPAIKAFLDQIGIPYDVYVANDGGVPNPMPPLWDGVGHGYYQGIILEIGNQWYFSGGGFSQFLSIDTWTALWNYEVQFGVRQLVMYVAPNEWNAESFGLAPLSEGYLTTTTPATLTADGQGVFPYLNSSNTIPFINTYYYRTTLLPADPTTNPYPAKPLLTLDGSPVVVTHQAADGHESMAIMADYTAYLISSLALSYGAINWLTQGVFLGERHSYLAPQVDDLLIDDNVWDPATMSDANDDLTYRMSGDDLQAVINWQNTNFPGDPIPTDGTVCTTIQPGPAAGQDTYLKDSNPDNNFGNAANLYTGAANRKTTNLRSLIKFDLTSFATGTEITSARFSIYLSSSSGSAAPVEIHAMPTFPTWVEGSGGAKRSASGATWNTYDGRNPWGVKGGNYSEPVAATFVAGTPLGWKETDLTDMVKGWVSNSSSNNGMMLLSQPASNTTNNQKAYYSSDYTNASLRPKLEVCYKGEVQEPTSTFKMEFAFNGEGTTAEYNEGRSDTLTPAVIAQQANFRWVNHTYSHISLSEPPATYQQSWDELESNHLLAIDYLGLTHYSKAPFIQPDISGLDNPDFQQAAYAFGVRYLISDTSRDGWNNPSPNTGIPSALQPGILIIPRRPTNLFYNLVTPEQWVSEYNCYYGPVAYPQCANGQWNFWSRDLTYEEILDKESDMMLQYLLKWDVDPLMFHQANLGAYAGENTLLTDLLDATLAKYRQLVNLPIRNLSQVEIGEKMLARMAYNQANVQGVLTPGWGISLYASGSATVPLTGVSCGTQEVYGGQSISYVSVGAGETVTVPLSCP